MFLRERSYDISVLYVRLKPDLHEAENVAATLFSAATFLKNVSNKMKKQFN